MTTVWKYTLQPWAQPTVLAMPAGAAALRVGVQGEDICLWALVDPDMPANERRFLVVGTGHRHQGLRVGAYVGTVDYPGGLVFHVFEQTP